MPYLQYRDQRVAFTPAEQAIGAFEGAVLRVPGDDPAARAIVKLGADGTGIILRGIPDAVVYVNGVLLGAEPSPLLHGDKVELGGHQLHYGDDTKGGSTQFISAASLAEQVKAAGASPRKPTSATGGRLVSLVDGREYAVPDAGVTFGREIGNEIVIASGDVSRRHATIAPSGDGYLLTDLSTNGVLVNNERVAKQQVLGRGDVIKIGGEEFRFYADKVKEPAVGVPPPAPMVTPAPAPTAATPSPAEPAAATPPATPPAAPEPAPAAPPLRIETAADAALAAPSVPPRPPSGAPGAAPADAAPTEPRPIRPAAEARPALATLEVINEGPMKGTRFEVFTPLTNIGRGAHNDVIVSDDSVSDSHAKLLRKEGHWFVADQGSTNGTYVGGRRIQGEQQLVGAPDVRFGNIKLIFRPSAAGADTGGGTRAIAAMSVEQARRMSTHQKPAPAPAAKPEKEIVLPEIKVPEKKGCASVIAVFLAVGAAGAGLLSILLIIGG